MANRTVKQQAWIEAMLTGVTPTEAARRAGYKTNICKHEGHMNTTKQHLMQEISRRKAELSAETGYTVAQAQKEYEEARLLAMRIEQPAAASTAVTGKARLFGMDKDAGDKDEVPVLSPAEFEAARAAAEAVMRTKTVRLTDQASA